MNFITRNHKFDINDNYVMYNEYVELFEKYGAFIQ